MNSSKVSQFLFPSPISVISPPTTQIWGHLPVFPSQHLIVQIQQWKHQTNK